MNDILQIIKNKYLKILQVNLKARSYSVIKSPDDEPYNFSSIDEYWEWFYESDLIYANDKEKIISFLKDAESGKSVIYRRKIDKDYKYVVMELLPYNDYFVLLVRDIDEIYNTELPLVMSKAQRIDGMTGLLNHKAFEEDVKREPKGNLGIAYIDINGLKAINDSKGHLEGDKVIIECAKILKEQFPAYNIYRTGGDEFIVVGFNVKLRVFLHTVIALHKRIWQSQPLFSIGYSGDRAEDIDDILRDAESQMYEDKQIFYEHYPQYKR